jgi:hypothetical protein
MYGPCVCVWWGVFIHISQLQTVVHWLQRKV